MDQASGSGEAAAVAPAERPRSAPEQHWLARLSFLFVGLAVVFVAVFAELKSLTMLAVGLVGAAVTLAAAYFFLSRRGVWRWLSLAVFVLTPIAGIAAEHGIPFVVISAGTRNHFALDLGLNRENPSACLGALSDGVELRVDLGRINGQVFVNNASFGAYAEVVETPAYRDDKLNT